MKKFVYLLFLLMVSMGTSAQKMVIKTASGQVIEITCDGGATPEEIAVIGDSVVFKMAKTTTEVPTEEVPTEEVEENADSLSCDSLESDSLSSDSLSYDSLEEERPLTKEEFLEQAVGPTAVQTANFLSGMFKMFWPKDSTFVPSYPQRKRTFRRLRAYDVVEINGSLGKDIERLTGGIDPAKITEEDYGDDLENETKWGGGLKYSRVYALGKLDEKGEWTPSPSGFAWSLGGLVAYSYQKDIGSYVDIMGKVGIQIGNRICIGVDGLIGCGVTPYKTFISNDMDYGTISKSAFCFKYGVQLWGSLNFSGDTYTAIFGRFVTSVRPSPGSYDFQGGWEVVYEDFDPSSWTFGLAVGYKFGAPRQLSKDKRLQAIISSGYNAIGNKGGMLSVEIERLTNVAKKLNLTYGACLEQTFENKKTQNTCTSAMASVGFNVCQPMKNSFVWGAKLMAGIGEYPVTKEVRMASGLAITHHDAKVCFRAALQLTAGYKFGNWQVYGACRGGYHVGPEVVFEEFDENSSSTNVKGFDLGFLGGLKYNF